MLHVFDFFGSFGLVLLLVAFYMNKTDKWSNKSVRYNIVNALGAGILVLYALKTGGRIFIVLETIWMLVAIKGIIENFK
ncbi:MAG: hypothetical protein ABEK36_04100 [Candidatus Aenigmatarchaeota archaeon]